MGLGPACGADSPGQPGEVSELDVQADSPGEAVDGAVADADGGPPTDVVPRPEVPPGEPGRYAVGARTFSFFDAAQGRALTTEVWYPALPEGQPKTYLFVLPSVAYEDAPADGSGGPYPLVLFSHGFKGIGYQSITLTTHLASHGFVVAAPDHVGNTLFDSASDDETVAKTAVARPKDLAFVAAELVTVAKDAAHPLHGLIDAGSVAVSGHSFGGYTALVAGGGVVDVAEAQAACQAGSPSDIFCDYVFYWPAGTQLALDPPIPGLKALVALAPGGASAFGAVGLSSVGVPALVVGGSLDTTTELDVEIHPIYAALPKPKAELVITGAGHMSFTDICSLDIAKVAMAEWCSGEGLLPPAEVFATADAVATAFLRYWMKGDAAMRSYLSETYVSGALDAGTFASEGIP